jgi:hypothetical protein
MNEEPKQDYGVLIAKKAERLVTALYLVTDLIAENEPIKHSLRKNSVALLSSMNAVSQLDAKDRFTEFKMSLKSVTEVISLLHVAGTTGIVSEMNGKLLTDGFRALQLVLEKKQPVLTKDMLLIDNEESLGQDVAFTSAISSSSYDVITPRAIARLHGNERDLRRTEEALKQAQLLRKLNKTSNKGQSVGDVKDNSKRQNENEIIKDKSTVHSVLIQHTQSAVVQPQLASSFQMRKQSRREQILALFVRGVDVSIKDIVARIRGCSEKTIQRELNVLLDDGVIRRIGEKRWSRYILK